MVIQQQTTWELQVRLSRTQGRCSHFGVEPEFVRT